VAVVAICNPALAQDVQAPGAAPGAASSEIVVTGFKQSLEDALNMKRSNSGVSDSISSEDIGKSTDQNIAEALQRVTGVAIDRTDGEGSTVTVRGAGPDLNNVTLNGVPLSANGPNQSVDFSQFSSDILQSITVNKTASADQNEGSLGGTIQLKTFRPLTVRKDRLILEVQGRYNEFLNPKGRFSGLDDLQDYRLNASFVKRFFDNTLGVSLVATKETSSLRKDEFNNTWFLTSSYPTAIDYTTLDDPDGPKTILNYDSNGDGVNDRIVGREHRQISYNYYVNQRDRNSINGSIQWKPNRDTEVVLNATYSRQRIENFRSEISTGTNTNNRGGPGSTLIFDPTTNTFLENIFLQTFSPTAPTPVQLRRPGTIRVNQTEQAFNVDNLILSGEINRRFGKLNVSLKGGRSITTQEDEYHVFGRSNVPVTDNSTINLSPTTGLPLVATAATAPTSTFFYNGYSCLPDPTVCRLVINPELPDNPVYFRPQNLNLRDLSYRDEIYSAFLDFDWDVEFGPITGIKFGGKYEDRRKNTAGTTKDLTNAELGGQFAIGTLLPYTQGKTPSDFGANIGLPRDTVTDGWFIWNLQQNLADAFAAAGGEPVLQPDLRNIRDIQQTVYGAYAMAEFGLFDKRVWGNVGVRYAKTDVFAQGFAGLQYDAVDFFTPDNKAFFSIDPEDPTSNAQLAALIGQNTFGRNADGTTRVGGTLVIPPTAISDTFSYENWLPSFNVNWAVKRNLLVRFGASETIARPPIDNLKPGFVISESYLSPNSIGTFGNTQLRPFKSRNLDLSVEWYSRKDSLFSVALFDKKLSDFVETSNTLYYWRDVRDQIFDQTTGVILPDDQITFSLTNPDQILLTSAGGNQQPGCMPNREFPIGSRQPTPPGTVVCDQLNVSRPRNGSGGYVRGVEVTLQHNFSWLPGFFGGFGMQANYTYSDSKTDEEIEYDANTGEILNFFPAFPLVGTSKHTANATVFWEKKGNLVRLAYNWRSDYLTNRNIRDGGAHWLEGDATLDLSASWKVTNNFTVNFQAQNLLDTVSRTYSTIVLDNILPPEGSAFDGATKTRTQDISSTGRVYRAGLRFQF